MTLSAHQLGCMRGDQQLFGAIDFQLHPGNALRVTGINGSGKTSMLRILSGIAVAAQGQVRWNGRDIRSGRDAYCGQRLYMGHASGIKDDLLAWENVALAALLCGIRIGRGEACQALARMGLEGGAGLPARSLSQGQRKRLALTRLQFAGALPLWILDEPFTALDQPAATALCGVLDGHLAAGGMLVYVTHQEVALAAQARIQLDVSVAA
jgi:heme exporter protein A